MIRGGGKQGFSRGGITLPKGAEGSQGAPPQTATASPAGEGTVLLALAMLRDALNSHGAQERAGFLHSFLELPESLRTKPQAMGPQ